MNGYVVDYEKVGRQYFNKFYDVDQQKTIDIDPADVELFTGVYDEKGMPIYEGDIVDLKMPFSDINWKYCEICLPLDITERGQRRRLYCYDDFPYIHDLIMNWGMLPWTVVDQTLYLGKGNMDYKTKSLVCKGSNVFQAEFDAATYHRRIWIERQVERLNNEKQKSNV